MRFARLGKILLLVLGSVLICEALLQVGARLFPIVDRTVPLKGTSIERFFIDPRNGYRGNPAYPEHDDWGFRNPERPVRADVVTLGDSWTFGTVVSRDEVWPVLLAEISGREVYNMAMGGSTPINYLQSFHQALRLAPQLIIASFYFGNDFIVTDKTFGMDRADGVFDRIAEEVVKQAREYETPPDQSPAFLLNCGQNADKSREKTGLRKWLSRNTRLSALIRGWRQPLERWARRGVDGQFRNAVASLDERQRRYCAPFAGTEWKTVLSNAGIARNVDPTNPRVRAGLEVAIAVIDEMQVVTRRSGIDFMVVLFPTKETVFRDRVRRSGAAFAPEVLAELDVVDSGEALLRDSVMAHMTETGITFVDTLPALRGATEQPFFGDVDTHPNAFGNRVIARAVAEALAVSAPRRRVGASG